jgi:hypothetical protein
MWITELEASGAKKYDTKSLKIGLSSENLAVLCHWEVARGKFGHVDSIHPAFWPKSIHLSMLAGLAQCSFFLFVTTRLPAEKPLLQDPSYIYSGS